MHRSISYCCCLSFLFLLAACSSNAPVQKASPQGFRSLSIEDEFNCRIEGLVFREFGVQRDQGQKSRSVAIASVRKTITGLAHSQREQTAANLALDHSESIADLAYLFKELRPDTLVYYGSNICQMYVAGDRDQQNPVTLAKLSLACQTKYFLPLDKRQLDTCIATEAIRLVHKPQ